MIDLTGWPQANSSILYNFETHAEALAPTSELLKRWSAHKTLWDYSAANVLQMRAQGVDAWHVPLGYTRTLEPTANSAIRDVDVLFVGRLEGARVDKLRRLRESGLRVLHGNADGPLFGERLRRLLERTKIVLSLRFWTNSADEWKMTRYLPVRSSLRCI